MPLNALAPMDKLNSHISLANSQKNLVNPEIFYTKQLLDTIRIDAVNYVYHALADEQPLQEKADKLVLRRWSPLRAHTTPLQEGVPPTSDKGTVRKYEMQANQYGRYMEFTDKVNFAVVDPIIAHYSKEYSIVAIETLDLLAREELLAKAQKFYPNGKTAEADLTPADVPRLNDLRLIVLSFKRQLVKPRMNGMYKVIVSPEFVYDMLDDPLVQKYMTINQSTGKMYDSIAASALPAMFGLEFEETLVAPITGDTLIGEVTLYKDYEASDDALISGDPAVRKIGDYVIAHIPDPNLNPPDNSKPYKFQPAPTSLSTEGYVEDPRYGTMDMSYLVGPEYQKAHYPVRLHPDTVAAGWKVIKKQHILVVGKDALTRTGLAGEGQAKMYTKPLGSAGVLDPIDQRQSIGFKINSVGYGSTRLEAIVDYVCVPTQLI